MKLKGLVLDILDRYVNNHKFQIVNIMKPRLGDAYACSIFEKPIGLCQVSHSVQGL